MPAGLLLGAAVLLSIASARAVVVRVLARSRLQVNAAETEAGVRARARLTDELGLPLAGREVRLWLEGGETHQATTDAQGRTPPWLVPLSQGAHELRAAFDGDRAGHAPSEAQRRVTVRPPLPRIHLQGRQQLGPGEGLTLRAIVEVRGRAAAGLRLDVSSDGRPLAGGRRTDSFGRARIRLSEAEVGGAGLHRIEVWTPESDRLRSASAHLLVLRKVPTRLDLSWRLDEGLVEDELALRGRLMAGEAEPLGDRRIELLGAQRRWSTRSDSQGRFEHAVPVGLLPPGESEVQARYLGEPGLDPASAAVTVVLPEPEPRSALPYALAAGMTAALLLALALGPLVRRTRAWLARWPARAAGTAADPAHREPLHPTLSRFAPARSDAAEPSDPLLLTGVLWDRVEDRPIAGGLVALVREDPEAPAAGLDTGAGRTPAPPVQGAGGRRAAPTGRSEPTAETDEGGRFSLRAPGPGRWWLHGAAPDYVDAHEALTLPGPFGGARGVRLGLMPVREMVRQVYVAAARSEAATAASLWGKVTPRQLLSELRGAPEAFVQLTRLVERVYYGRGPHAAERYGESVALAGGARRTYERVAPAMESGEDGG